jgi:hypothetical protein
MLKVSPTLKTLCGKRGNETELDMHGKMNGLGDAIMLATEVIDNGALLHLDISNTEIRAEGVKVFADALKDNQVVTTLNVASNMLARNSDTKVDISGVIALADVIPGMRALSVLNLADNNLGELVLQQGWTKVSKKTPIGTNLNI